MADVPRIPGVPLLPAYSAIAVATVAPSLLNFGIDVWGIFLNGVPALVYNSTLSLDFKREWTISDYPVEKGGFQSYNKVQVPFTARVRITSGGSFAERQALLNQIDAIAGSLLLYDILTPEKIYTSCNVTHYDYQRHSDRGLGMITIDIWFEEVRVTATATLSNTQQPSVAGQRSNGVVQAQDTTDIQNAMLAQGIM